MPDNSDQLQVSMKERIREEINAQVEEFLRRGGQIRVVDQRQRAQPASMGSVWIQDDGFDDLGG